MTDTRWERLAAAGGFISVVLSLAYIFLSPGVDALASASEVASGLGPKFCNELVQAYC
jgi:hypothetical protein